MVLDTFPPIPQLNRKRSALWTFKVIAVIPFGIFRTLNVGSPTGKKIAINGSIILCHSTPIKAGTWAFPPVFLGEIVNPLFRNSEELLELLGCPERPTKGH
jgi:hypothetical protein